MPRIYCSVLIPNTIASVSDISSFREKSDAIKQAVRLVLMKKLRKDAGVFYALEPYHYIPSVESSSNDNQIALTVGMDLDFVEVLADVDEYLLFGSQARKLMKKLEHLDLEIRLIHSPDIHVTAEIIAKDQGLISSSASTSSEGITSSQQASSSLTDLGFFSEPALGQGKNAGASTSQPLSRKLDLHLFDDISLPHASKDKNIFLFIIHNLPDGIGDFKHGIDFVERLSPLLRSKGYQVYGLITTYTQPDKPDSQVSQIGRYIMDEVQKGYFDKALCFCAEPDMFQFMQTVRPAFLEDPSLSELSQMKLNQWINENSISLQHLFSHIAGGVEVSCPTIRFSSLAPKGIYFVNAYQYGSNSPNYGLDLPAFNTVFHAPMGSLNPKSHYQYGIKMTAPSHRPDFASQTLLTITEKNPAFVQTLLATKEPSQEQINEYFSSHYFMPGYLQTEEATSVFIITQVLRYLADDKVCDFFLPAKMVNTKAVALLLQQIGLQETDYVFLSEASASVDTYNKPKVRILSFRIADDQDYDALFEIANASVAASGDNTISLAFSRQFIPWYQFKKTPNPIAYFYSSELPEFINGLITQANTDHDEPLSNGLLTLKNYFNHLNQFLQHGQSAHWRVLHQTIDTELKDPTIQNEISGNLIGYCTKTVELLKKRAHSIRMDVCFKASLST